MVCVLFSLVGGGVGGGEGGREVWAVLILHFPNILFPLEFNAGSEAIALGVWKNGKSCLLGCLLIFEVCRAHALLWDIIHGRFFLLPTPLQI